MKAKKLLKEIAELIEENKAINKKLKQDKIIAEYDSLYSHIRRKASQYMEDEDDNAEFKIIANIINALTKYFGIKDYERIATFLEETDLWYEAHDFVDTYQIPYWLVKELRK